MIGFFEHEYLKYKKDHLKNLVALANIDGELHHKERNLLYSIGEKYGLKGWQIAKIIESNDPFEIKMPEEKEKRLDQIFDLVSMMLADDIIDENEMSLCISVTSNYGFKTELVYSILELIKNGKSGKYHWNIFKEKAVNEYTE